MDVNIGSRYLKAHGGNKTERLPPEREGRPTQGVEAEHRPVCTVLGNILLV